MDKSVLFIYFAAVFITDIWCKSLNLEEQLEAQGDDGEKIVGGNETQIESYPYQAYLLMYDGREYFQCGGAIASEYCVITAAHCLARKIFILVRIGSTYSNSGGIQYNTSDFISHPNYDDTTSDYDIGVVTVAEGMDLVNTAASPISLPGYFNDPEEGQSMTITGWGRTSEGGSTTTILRVAQVPVVSRTDCNTQLNGGVTSRMFCAGYEEGGIDTCQGDSGGPIVSDRTGKLSGVTSYGYGCARPNSPGVYTRIGQLYVRLFLFMRTGL